MKLSSRWRRRPLAGYVVLALALALFGVGYALFWPSGHHARAASQRGHSQLVARGEQLFSASCASCHGTHGEGTGRAPSLVGVGAAAVHFQVSTGRMPATNPHAAHADAKEEIRYSTRQIRAMAAYVATFGSGPAIPSDGQVAYKDAELAIGGELFRANCAECHQFTGEGGPLTYGRIAPNLTEATPRQIWEAMQTGPASMPVFRNGNISPDQKRSIIHYIKFTSSEHNPGGFSLGRFGPMPEGAVGWGIGMGLVILAAMWISARKHD